MLGSDSSLQISSPQEHAFVFRKAKVNADKKILMELFRLKWQMI